MSELIQKNDNRATIRWKLLTSASALALTSYVLSMDVAKAEDADHPPLWIELGGQLEQQMGHGDAFVPAFIANNPTAPAFQGFNLQAQKPALFSTGVEGKVTFEPDGTNWVFSAAFLYGRANGKRNINHVTAGHRLHNKTVYVTHPSPTASPYRIQFRCCSTHYYTPPGHAFANMQTRSRQSHSIIDFQAGRDVGLGLFSHGSSSVVSAGVRFVQFVSRSNTTIHALPDLGYYKHIHHFYGYTLTNYYALPQHPYAASAEAVRSFHGVGPAISWNGSTPLLGNPQAGEVAFDWGANAAILFGRQRVAGNHQTYGYYNTIYRSAAPIRYTHIAKLNRQRSVTIPNVGGFAGLSFQFPNAKISIGYRGDFFFGALDGGIDARKSKTVGFYGPFASISVGLGD